MTVFDNRLAPVTSTIGLLDLPVRVAAEALLHWRTRTRGEAKVTELRRGLEDSIHYLEPLTGAVTPRELVVATSADGWSAVFDCGVQGGDQVTTVGYLCREMKCKGLVVTHVPHDLSSDGSRASRYGAVKFEMFGPLSTDFLNYVRTISLTYDGSRWQFDVAGLVQHFEDTGSYTARRMKDRFTFEMLREYCAALDLSPFEDSFYPGPSVLIESPIEPPSGALVLSLQDARRYFGISST